LQNRLNNYNKSKLKPPPLYATPISRAESLRRQKQQATDKLLRLDTTLL
jgi:hypothetical protein